MRVHMGHPALQPLDQGGLIGNGVLIKILIVNCSVECECGMLKDIRI